MVFHLSNRIATKTWQKADTKLLYTVALLGNRLRRTKTTLGSERCFIRVTTVHTMTRGTVGNSFPISLTKEVLTLIAFQGLVVGSTPCDLACMPRDKGAGTM